jgi:hypothetical protein
MVSKCGPGPFVVFISVVCVISFVVYLSVEFLKKVLFLAILFAILFVFCLDPVVGIACGLREICTLPFSVLWDG